ncbi:MAG: hypothetical protein QOI82_2879 [Actinomycetota bacterium]|jgi:hypothetical protein|nr:hypothetical protein [Actinomycetota bacterium]
MKVYVEATDKKAFACVVDWPGWCRSSRSEEAALEQLIAYQDRYADVAALAGVAFRPGKPAVVERVEGNATTTFGAPGVVPQLDHDAKLTSNEIMLLEASWDHLDGVATSAPSELRKGPRGGGRDRDKMLQHVVSAEASYARKIGVKHKEPAITDPAAVEAMRADILTTLRAGAAGTPWPLTYFVRRTAWHVLDHAWEMQDRSTA